YDTSGNIIDSTTTRRFFPKGYYELTHVPKNVTFVIQASKKGFESESKTVFTDTDKHGVDFHLKLLKLNVEVIWPGKDQGAKLYNGETFTVHVTDSNGTDVEGAKVVYQYKSLLGWARTPTSLFARRTDSSGEVTFVAWENPIDNGNGNGQNLLPARHAQSFVIRNSNGHYNFIISPTPTNFDPLAVGGTQQISMTTGGTSPTGYVNDFNAVLTQSNRTFITLWDSLSLEDDNSSDDSRNQTLCRVAAWMPGHPFEKFYSETFFVYRDRNDQPSSCFLAGTQVELANGTIKPIEEIKTGDIVKSYDTTAGGQWKTGVVTQLFHHTAEEMTDYYLVINNDLKVTPNHPVYVNNQWIPAGQLQIGDMFGGSTITSIEKVYKKVPVYNIEVEPYHNYKIIWGDDKNTIVHNAQNPYINQTTPVDPVDPGGNSIVSDKHVSVDVNLQIHQINDYIPLNNIDNGPIAVEDGITIYFFSSNTLS
ncbi:hypothetical protein DRN50_08725, partial [Thermococci archaeon]